MSNYYNPNRKRNVYDPISSEIFRFAHEKIDEWRDSLRGGITARVDNTNVVITGGVDDMWVTPAGEYVVVDYKATSKEDCDYCRYRSAVKKFEE